MNKKIETMSTRDNLDKVLGFISVIRNDNEKLIKLLEFLEEMMANDSCLEDEEADEYDVERLPEKYRTVVKEIAGNLDVQIVSYLNPDTLEVDFSPEDDFLSGFGEEEEEDNGGEKDPKSEWKDYITITPPKSHESYEIMEDFVEQLKDKRAASRLSQALNGAKPFANFNHIIHNSSVREEWFDFKETALERYVVKNYLYDLIKS